MLDRRKFLIGSSAIALLSRSDEASAFIHRAPVSPQSAAKVQLGVGSGEASAFLNFLSLGFGSFQASGGTYAYPSILNADGYPTGTITTTIFGSCSLPSNLTASDTLVLAWTGTTSAGVIELLRGAPGFTVTVGSGFVSGGTGNNILAGGTNGYIEFNFVTSAPASLTVGFAAGTYTGFGGLILCRKSDYATIIAATSAQQLLSPNYVNAMKALNPKSLRPLGWTDPNDNNVFTQHRYRKNWQTNLGFSLPTWIPSCWAGGPGTAGPNITSGGIGNAFVAAAATDTPVAYTMGEVIQGQIDVAGSGTGLTINVGGRGAVPLFNTSGSALSAASVTANALVTMIYDDLLGGYIYGGDATAHVPVESQIGLANAVGCPLWYQFPPHITTMASVLEATSSVSQIATLIASTLNSGGYFEWANEIWNFANGFSATSWAGACGTLFGFTTSNDRYFHGFYGYKVATIMPQVVSAWGAKSGLKIVMASAVGGAAGSAQANQTYRFNGADLASVANGGAGNSLWISYTGNANFTAFPNRPVDLADTLAYATYYSGAQCANFDANYRNVGGTGLTTGGPTGWTTGLLGAADAYAVGGATNIANALAFLDWDFRQGTNNGSNGGETLLQYTTLGSNGFGAIGYYSTWETIAQAYDGARPSGKVNLTIENYEGGMQATFPSTAECTALGISTTYGGATGLIGNLLTGYKNSALFKQLVQDQYTQFFATPPVSPSVVNHSVAGSWLEMTGNNQWSMYPGDVYTTPYQSYAGVEATD